jgi:hypothetical protein
MKKFVAFTAVFFSSLFFIFSQNIKRPDSAHKDWRILEKAQVAYDNGKYGDAVQLVNSAKDSHVLEIKWEEQVLTRALSPSAVRKAGDSLDDILEILKERDENAAVDLINSYTKRYGDKYFDSSISQLVSWIEAKVVYPEADFLLGKIYRLEGEYQLSDTYYEQARNNSKYLDIPDQRFDILYAMAELAHDKNDLETYEQTLLLILDEDQYYNDDIFMNALIRTIDFDKPTSFEKFFELYRSNSDHSIQALYLLEKLYEKRDQQDKALRCAALGVADSFTHILASIQERDSLYVYTDFSTFLKKTEEYDDIVDWGKSNNVWELMFVFGKLCGQRGKLVFARSAFTVFSDAMPDTYWKTESSHQLADSSVSPKN